jgi:hypothetical protein
LRERKFNKAHLSFIINMEKTRLCLSVRVGLTIISTPATK